MPTSTPKALGSVAERAPLARSPITPAPPVGVVGGWEVSAQRSVAALRLVDWTPLAKVLVRAEAGSAAARALGVPFGRAARDPEGTLVVGSGPGEWTLLGRPGTAAALVARWEARASDELVTVVDLTSAQALLRLTGTEGPRLLAKVCAIDLDDAAAPNGTAFRSSVAEVVTDVVRDDLSGERSYLLHCDRSYGQYLFDALLDAGGEFAIDVDGFR